jgi:hypothetical protein
MYLETLSTIIAAQSTMNKFTPVEYSSPQDKINSYKRYGVHNSPIINEISYYHPIQHCWMSHSSNEKLSQYVMGSVHYELRKTNDCIIYWGIHNPRIWFKDYLWVPYFDLAWSLDCPGLSSKTQGPLSVHETLSTNNEGDNSAKVLQTLQENIETDIWTSYGATHMQHKSELICTANKPTLRHNKCDAVYSHHEIIQSCTMASTPSTNSSLVENEDDCLTGTLQSLQECVEAEVWVTYDVTSSQCKSKLITKANKTFEIIS